MLIKGKYVAQLEINISADENTPGLLPMDEIKENMNNFTGALKNLIEDEVDENTHVAVTKLFADVWKSEDERSIAPESLRPTREQVEKAWGEWIPVMESEITGFNPKFAGRDPICGYKCSRCKAEAVLDCNDEFVLSNFCPACGAPMTDGAVDIVMERLETIYGETKAD